MLHQIGAGALGPVFRAFDPANDRLVAIKLFRLDLPPERVHQLVADFERLVDAQLTHPAIAAPLAAGMRDNQAFLATELVQAESLDIVVRDHGPAPVDHAIAIAAQLAGAIDFAAVVHVGHGALHPRDVLVSPEETRVTGFGIAQALTRAGVVPSLRRPYAAPERVDNGAWRREADIFSIAAICYELLMGRRIAGTGSDAANGLVGVAGLDIELARAVFARAFAVDPAHRFATALEFVDALKHSAVDVNAAGLKTRATDDAGLKTRATDDAGPKTRATDDAGLKTRATDDAGLKTRATDDEKPRLPLDELPPVPIEPIIDIPPAVTSSPFSPSDLDLVKAETDRYQDVESSPAVTPDLLRPDPVPLSPEPLALSPDHTSPLSPAPLALSPDHASPLSPAPLALSSDHTSPLSPAPSALSPDPQSTVWPLVLALVVGLALGFAAGYGVGIRESSSQPLAATAGVPSTREFTESTVPSVPAAAGAGSATAPTSAAGPVPGAARPGHAATAAPPTKAATSTAGASRAPAGPPASVANPAESAASEAGRLLIRSTPEGARVYVDGRERGRTPLALRDLAHGAHRVRVVQDGYVSEERRVELTARRPSQSMQIALVRPALRQTTSRPEIVETFVGVLTVESRPNGASVYVDGRLAGTTPLTIQSVAAGSHAVRLERDGYRRWSSSVRVVAGERNRVTASLEK